MADMSGYFDATNEEEMAACLQAGIDDGSVWLMEGSIGRTAMDYLKRGLCVLPEMSHRDYWGSKVPSRHDVKPGTVGSLEYAERMREEGE